MIAPVVGRYRVEIIDARTIRTYCAYCSGTVTLEVRDENGETLATWSADACYCPS